MAIMMREVMILLLTAMLLPISSRAIKVDRLRQLARKNNVTCILVFGDSSVDPGNNNHLVTFAKSNYLPYGKSFHHGQPTGRFSNGRLATDFIAEALGYTNVIPAFLDFNLKKEDLIHGVSFASAGSGYDDLTANFSHVLTVPEQIKYFLHYKIHLSKSVGQEAAEMIIKNAIFVISMGTNDFLQNYYLEPARSQNFSIDQYQNFLINRFTRDVKVLHGLGLTRLAVVGVPPMGCMPLVKTLLGEDNKCVDTYNKVAQTFNYKIQKTLATLSSTLGIKKAYIDIYQSVMSALQYPQKYGMKETMKGCVGTGLVEYGDTCKDMTTCAEPDKYVFWDAIHPTQKMYEIIVAQALHDTDESFLC